eukprot:2347272-Rhodomonas_salina.1
MPKQIKQSSLQRFIFFKFGVFQGTNFRTSRSQNSLDRWAAAGGRRTQAPKWVPGKLLQVQLQVTIVLLVAFN